MTNKTLNSLFGVAAKEGAKRIVISGSKNGPSFSYHLPSGEEAIFNLPKKLETNLASNLRQLLKIAPGELSAGKYCKLNNKNYQLNFRLSIIPDELGEKIIINVIDEKEKIMSLTKLGLQKTEFNIIKNKIKIKSGLIVISSAERQGRSTTLRSLLTELDRDNKNIYFIGSESKLKLDGINYLDNKTENWDKLLQHDSDIIIVDVKNEDCLQKSILAASTGRLVIISLETINALEALYKIINSGLPLKLILDNLKMITNQELINLKRQKTKSKIERQKIGLFEIIIPNNAMHSFITNNEKDLKTEDFWKQLFQLATNNGYKPLIMDKDQKKHDGLI